MLLVGELSTFTLEKQNDGAFSHVQIPLLSVPHRRTPAHLHPHHQTKNSLCWNTTQQ